MELWACPEDIPAIQELMREEEARNRQGLNYDPEQAAQVFDPSKDTAVCPACGTEFATSSTECPDCGLVIG